MSIELSNVAAPKIRGALNLTFLAVVRNNFETLSLFQILFHNYFSELVAKFEKSHLLENVCCRYHVVHFYFKSWNSYQRIILVKTIAHTLFTNITCFDEETTKMATRHSTNVDDNGNTMTTTSPSNRLCSDRITSVRRQHFHKIHIRETWRLLCICKSLSAPVSHAVMDLEFFRWKYSCIGISRLQIFIFILFFSRQVERLATTWCSVCLCRNCFFIDPCRAHS